MTKAKLPSEKKVQEPIKKEPILKNQKGKKITGSDEVPDKKPEVKKQPIAKSTAEKPIVAKTAKVKKIAKKPETQFIHHAGKSDRVKSFSM